MPHELDTLHFQDWDNPHDPGEWVVDCSCGYRSRGFLRKADADTDGDEHAAQAHPA